MCQGSGAAAGHARILDITAKRGPRGPLGVMIFDITAEKTPRGAFHRANPPSGPRKTALKPARTARVSSSGLP